MKHSLLTWHVKGPNFHIAVDEDGLVVCKVGEDFIDRTYHVDQPYHARGEYLTLTQAKTAAEKAWRNNQKEECGL